MCFDRQAKEPKQTARAFLLIRFDGPTNEANRLLFVDATIQSQKQSPQGAVIDFPQRVRARQIFV